MISIDVENYLNITHARQEFCSNLFWTAIANKFEPFSVFF